MQKQVAEGNRDPSECIKISTQASLREMILPGLLVIVTPLAIGLLFGNKAIAGYLAGVIVSGVQMAISSSNSGGAWDNAKKFIEGEKLEIGYDEKNNLDQKLKDEMTDEENKKPNPKDRKVFHYTKSSEPHKAAVVGDTVGDPLKDTSGPSLNILIKLSAIVSLVFGTYFLENSILSL